MKKLLVALICMFIGCGGPNHEKERTNACEHSEGLAAGNCNAGDDFSPLTCLTAMAQLESWWRDDAQTAVNDCLISSACNPQADGIPGPSIVEPLQICLGKEITSSLQPTNAETQAVTKFCVKAGKCGELGDYTIAGCQEVLLNPYDDGPLFLMMNDQMANSVANCDQATCDNFNNCVFGVFQASGAFNNINGVGIKMPTLMQRVQ